MGRAHLPARSMAYAYGCTVLGDFTDMALSFFAVSVLFQYGPLRTGLVQATSLMICGV